MHVIASQLSRYCDVISNRLWRHQQNEDRASKARGRCVKMSFLSSFMDSLYCARNKLIYVFSWRTVSVLTWMLFLCLCPSLLRNSVNKHKNNPLVSAETVRHSSTYIILYIQHNQYDGYLLVVWSWKEPGHKRPSYWPCFPELFQFEL